MTGEQAHASVAATQGPGLDAAACRDAVAFELPPRWTPLRYHAGQRAYADSRARFVVNHAGRRSGKTEIAKRRLVRAALTCPHADGWYVAAAPTFAQAKRIFWDDLKALIPDFAKARTYEAGLTVVLKTGVKVTVLGLEKAERLEGKTLDGVVIDEYGNCKADVWEERIRPALSTPGRPGWAMFIGVPEGRNHYYRLAQRARRQTDGRWAVYHWHSEEVLDPEETAEARADTDPLTYAQEYGGEFRSFEGRAYYAYEADAHERRGLAGLYDPRRELAVCLDFNVKPGVAVACQELRDPAALDGTLTAAIGEVWISRDSNTPKVVRRLGKMFPDHLGPVTFYGDATGGAKGTAKVRGSDWDLVREEAPRAFPPGRDEFGRQLEDRVTLRVPRANPKERARVNAMNRRLRAASGAVSFALDPDTCPHLADDLDGVMLSRDGSGAIDKDRQPMLTHISDALGYYAWYAHGGRGRSGVIEMP